MNRKTRNMVDMAARNISKGASSKCGQGYVKRAQRALAGWKLSASGASKETTGGTVVYTAKPKK